MKIMWHNKHFAWHVEVLLLFPPVDKIG